MRDQPVKSVSPQQAKAAAPPLSPLEKVITRQTWKMSETLPEQDCSFPDFTKSGELRQF